MPVYRLPARKRPSLYAVPSPVVSLRSLLAALLTLHLAGSAIPTRADPPATTDDVYILPLNSDPFLVAQLPAATQAQPSLTSPRPLGTFVVRRVGQVRWAPGGNSLHATGGVEIDYTDAKDGKLTTVTADTLDYDGTSGLVKASGGVQMVREEGTFTGQEIVYNLQSRGGYVTEASVSTDYFRMRGKRIETRADGSYVVTDGVFTTCVNARPDYEIHARQLTVAPNRYVSARHITFYAGRTSLITLPSLRRNLNNSSSVPFPTIGYNKEDGLILRFRDTPLQRPHQTFEYDLRANVHNFPEGLATYQADIYPRVGATHPPTGIQTTLADPLRGLLEQFAPPTYSEYAESTYGEPYPHRITYYATLQNEQFVYNRRRTDLSISRYPEVGVRFANLLGHAPPSAADPSLTDAGEQRLNPTPVVRRRIGDAPALLDIFTSICETHEEPTRVTAGRFAVRANLASQPFLLGKRLSWRLGVSDWFNLYTTGTAYNIVSPEAELDYTPTRTSVFNIGYRFLSDKGTTPFLFDRRDIRQEMRLQLQVGGPWAFGYLTRYDVERARFYDSEFAIVRNFDCMQVGASYRLRTQQFSIIFNLLPPVRDRARRRQMPLNPNRP